MKILTQSRNPAAPSSLIVLLVLLSAAFIAYAPALNGAFLWDDEYLVGSNPFFKSPIFLLEVFRQHLFVDSISAYYRPVQNISYMPDYWLWGSDPFGYHIANVAYHALAGFLIYRLLRRIVPGLCPANETSPVIAWLPLGVALVWCIHPIHNAGVAYISGRADSLAAIFSLSAWLIALRALETRKTLSRILLATIGVLSMVLALGSKEIALVWLALFVTWAWLFRGTTSRKISIALTAGALVSLGLYYLIHSLPEARAAIPPDQAAPLSLRVLLMFRALGDYTSLIFYPDVLRMERMVFNPAAGASLDHWIANIRLEYLGILGAATLAAFAGLSISRKPGQKIRVFGAVWFFVGFLPISNLFPLNAQVAEHWIYMPSAGFLLFLGGCFPLLPQKSLRFAAVAVALFAIALTARTAMRSADWSDPKAFYLTTIENGGGSPRVLLNLAAQYADSGDMENAETLGRKIFERYPGYAGARIQLGSLLLRVGKSEEARRLLETTPAENAKMAATYGNGWAASEGRAKEAYQRGQFDEAIRLIDEGIVTYPTVFRLVQFKGQMLQETHGSAAAIPTIQAYCDRYWWRYEPFICLGRLSFGAGDFDAAVVALRHAARLDVRNAEPHNLMARVEFARGHFDAALSSQRRAVKDAEFEPSQYLLLAEIHERLGHSVESKAALAMANELRGAVTR